MADDRNLSVGGYRFYTEKDAQLAAAELKKIEYLEARIDYSRPDSILTVYEKTIHERIFRTPVGLQYLKKLRDYLLKQPEFEPQRIPEIPLYNTFSGEVREKNTPARNRIKAGSGGKGGEKAGFAVSVILNILLVMAVICMFTMTLRSDNPNVLNYQRVITDRYAQWEQELKERENAIREKERELKLNDNGAVFTE
ncbi:MAG: hypothetical protein NC123_17515 [Butyrivibrio sp.]|nr:hypothetical protein [Acetatifactor muris]MCM1561315.1 hypothetical protein [Butyrivibrio sp.]